MNESLCQRTGDRRLGRAPQRLEITRRDEPPHRERTGPGRALRSASGRARTSSLYSASVAGSGSIMRDQGVAEFEVRDVGAHAAESWRAPERRDGSRSRRYFLRTAIIGSAAETVTVAVGVAHLLLEAARPSPSNDAVAPGSISRNSVGRPDLVEERDERLGVELFDVDHRARVPGARRRSASRRRPAARRRCS